MIVAQSSALLRAGLALKTSQIKRAVGSYGRDRANQGKNVVITYAISAGLFAASGIFLVAALLVGLAALFRWIQLSYGEPAAFGAIAAILLALTGLCLIFGKLFGKRRLKSPADQFPSLASRLRVAVKANPIKLELVKQTASAKLPTLQPHVRPIRAAKHRSPQSKEIRAGLLATAMLVGWAITRNRTPPSGADV